MSTETKVFAGLGAATILIVGIGAFLMGGNSTPDKPQPPVDSKILVHSDSHQIGPKSPKVTLVEFGDFQCPACGASHPVVKQLQAEYKDNLTFVFRNFPLPMHKNAIQAALAAEAAGEQGKFFEMHDLIFENQKDWSESNDPLGKYFIEYAKQLDLDIAKFEKAVKDKKYQSKIEKDQADGNSVGTVSTPTFFINGVKQSGGLPYTEFKAKIDSSLKN